MSGKVLLLDCPSHFVCTDSLTWNGVGGGGVVSYDRNVWTSLAHWRHWVS